MVHVNFVGIASMNVPSAGSLWRNESFYTKNKSLQQEEQNLGMQNEGAYRSVNQPLAVLSWWKNWPFLFREGSWID